MFLVDLTSSERTTSKQSVLFLLSFWFGPHLVRSVACGHRRTLFLLPGTAQLPPAETRGSPPANAKGCLGVEPVVFTNKNKKHLENAPQTTQKTRTAYVRRSEGAYRRRMQRR